MKTKCWQRCRGDCFSRLWQVRMCHGAQDGGRLQKTDRVLGIDLLWRLCLLMRSMCGKWGGRMKMAMQSIWDVDRNATCLDPSVTTEQVGPDPGNSRVQGLGESSGKQGRGPCPFWSMPKPIQVANWNLFYLFIFGCAGSSSLCRLFSSCGGWGLLSSCSAQALGLEGFSSCGSWALEPELQ